MLLATRRDVASRDLTLATAPHQTLDPITAIQSFYLRVEAVVRTVRTRTGHAICPR
ncbi:MAG: hypothetical protein ABIP34_06225 [Rhodoferax sp.]|uniref:hypothetical protein n=1 Tax=Rhodoferax sp. TaxID=50421 RepID=UPI0032633A45